ncbi:MAG TPA: hypothetical protein PKD85_01705 [Saprospiraceae bacterium]|nr:hypothetical protein [Saprospiraceae bacterium]
MEKTSKANFKLSKTKKSITPTMSFKLSNAKAESRFKVYNKDILVDLSPSKLYEAIEKDSILNYSKKYEPAKSVFYILLCTNINRKHNPFVFTMHTYGEPVLYTVHCAYTDRVKPCTKRRHFLKVKTEDDFLRVLSKKIVEPSRGFGNPIESLSTEEAIKEKIDAWAANSFQTPESWNSNDSFGPVSVWNSDFNDPLGFGNTPRSETFLDQAPPKKKLALKKSFSCEEDKTFYELFSERKEKHMEDPILRNKVANDMLQEFSDVIDQMAKDAAIRALKIKMKNTIQQFKN